MVCPNGRGVGDYGVGLSTLPLLLPPQVTVVVQTIELFPITVVVVQVTVPAPAEQESPLHDTDSVELSQLELQDVVAAKAELAMKSMKPTTRTDLTMRIENLLIYVKKLPAGPTAGQSCCELDRIRIVRVILARASTRRHRSTPSPSRTTTSERVFVRHTAGSSPRAFVSYVLPDGSAESEREDAAGARILPSGQAGIEIFSRQETCRDGDERSAGACGKSSGNVCRKFSSSSKRLASPRPKASRSSAIAPRA